LVEKALSALEGCGFVSSRAGRQEVVVFRKQMVLTREDLELLKRLKAADERGRTISEFNTRIALQRLARGGYVVARAGPELVNYRITQRGKDAVIEYDLK
jgi:hypothetical protein